MGFVIPGTVVSYTPVRIIFVVSGVSYALGFVAFYVILLIDGKLYPAIVQERSVRVVRVKGGIPFPVHLFIPFGRSSTLQAGKRSLYIPGELLR